MGEILFKRLFFSLYFIQVCMCACLLHTNPRELELQATVNYKPRCWEPKTGPLSHHPSPWNSSTQCLTTSKLYQHQDKSRGRHCCWNRILTPNSQEKGLTGAEDKVQCLSSLLLSRGKCWFACNEVYTWPQVSPPFSLPQKISSVARSPFSAHNKLSVFHAWASA